MNKKEISETIYERLEVRRFEAYNFIDLLIEVITENLGNNKKVVMSRFGTFKVVERQKKRVLNPNNQAPMFIPSRKIVKFYPSRNLRDLIGSRR